MQKVSIFNSALDLFSETNFKIKPILAKPLAARWFMYEIIYFYVRNCTLAPELE